MLSNNEDKSIMCDVEDGKILHPDVIEPKKYTGPVHVEKLPDPLILRLNRIEKETNEKLEQLERKYKKVETIEKDIIDMKIDIKYSRKELITYIILIVILSSIFSSIIFSLFKKNAQLQNQVNKLTTEYNIAVTKQEVLNGGNLDK